MNTRELLLVCILLVTASIFIVPETAQAGVDHRLAMGLSGVLLFGGIVTAVFTVISDRRDAEIERAKK